MERNGLEVGQEVLIKIRECITRANICNQSKSLQDNNNIFKVDIARPKLLVYNLLCITNNHQDIRQTSIKTL